MRKCKRNTNFGMNRISGLNDSVLSREAISQEEGDLSRMNEISAKFRTFFFFFLIFTILSKFESISSFIITYIYIDLPLQEFDFVETVSRSLHLYKYYFAETFETTESLEYFHITLVTYKFIIDRDFDSTKLLLRYIYI